MPLMTAPSCSTLLLIATSVEIIRRSDDVSGFKVLPRRRVVERTFGWMTRWRRLVRDYDKRLDVSEAMIHLAMAINLLWLITP